MRDRGTEENNGQAQTYMKHTETSSVLISNGHDISQTSYGGQETCRRQKPGTS
jgi:hypothetical protein